MHNRGYVYVDVKPQNFMIGYGEKAQVIHVVDLGGVVKAGAVFRNAGTLTYTSISSHQGKGTTLLKRKSEHAFVLMVTLAALTPQGDLESVGYVISELFYGSLPWAPELVAAKAAGKSAAALLAQAGARILALKQAASKAASKAASLFADFPGALSGPKQSLICNDQR
jgi:serine/threonine protein kinase